MWSTIRTQISEWHLSTRLMLLVVLFNLTDFLTTKVLVDRDGYQVESNPLLLSAMVWFDSVWAIFWIKTAIIALVWVAIRWYICRNDARHPICSYPLILVASIFATISVSNFVLIYVS